MSVRRSAAFGTALLLLSAVSANVASGSTSANATRPAASGSNAAACAALDRLRPILPSLFRPLFESLLSAFRCTPPPTSTPSTSTSSTTTTSTSSTTSTLPSTGVRVTTATLHDGIAGANYRQALSALGGREPYSWTASGLPSGLSATPEGVITGIPLAVAASTVTVTVTDADGSAATVHLNLAVPEALPLECLAKSCAVLTPDLSTVQIPSSQVVAVTRDLTTGLVDTVVISGPSPATDQVVVIAPTAEAPTGVIGLITSVSVNSDGSSTLALKPGTLSDAWAEGALQQLADTSPSAAPNRRAAPERAIAGESFAAAAATPSLACTGGVSLDSAGLGVTPDLAPSVVALWKRPLFGGGGFYPGTGGLTLFQFDLEGSITVDLDFKVSGASRCTATLANLRSAFPVGAAGAIMLSLRPTITLNVSGAAEVRTSVTLKCGVQYRWSKGVEYRTTYCGRSFQPLQLTAATGVDATLTAEMDASVTLNDIAGITGNLSASLHAGYRPTEKPLAQIDAKATYDLGACLACFWKGSPAQVSLVSGTIFDKVLARYDTAPPTVPPSTGTTTTRPPATTTSTIVPPSGGSSPASQVSAGGLHSCALVGAGAVQCWGDNRYGQLGDGTTTSSSTPVAVAGLFGATQVSAGNVHTCALVAGGAVKCWGRNNFGQLGDGTNTDSSTPVAIDGILGATQIAAAGSNDVGHTCALVAGGAVKCWGYNGRGQLGDGLGDGTGSSATPVTVADLSGATQISAGATQTCALVAGGSVTCWGSRGSGDEPGSGVSSSVPVPVDGISGATQISVGLPFPIPSGHACALVAGGAVKCWGDNGYGQLGDGTVNGRSTPAAVSGLSGATQIGAGGYHTCALVAGGAAKCWGDNRSGQLGDGTVIDRSTTASVSGISGPIQVSAGGLHTCALVADGAVKCWGDNSRGQLGDGTVNNRSTPVTVRL